MKKQRKKKFHNKDNLIIVASLLATISIIFFFLAGQEADKKEYNLFTRTNIYGNVRFLAGTEANRLTVWDDENIVLPENINYKIKEQGNQIGELAQYYIEFVRKERIYSTFGLAFIGLSLIANAFALKLK